MLKTKSELLKFKRIMIKLSGEALADSYEKQQKIERMHFLLCELLENSVIEGEEAFRIYREYKKLLEFGVNAPYVLDVCRSIKNIHDLGVEIGITVGGGNYWRGRTSSPGMDKVQADHIGMLGTVMNALTIEDAFNQLGVPVRAQTAVPIDKMAEFLIPKKAINHYEKGRIVVFGAGTGRTNSSTDSGAAINAVETNCNAIIKLTGNVDGVYTTDPRNNLDARKYKTINLQEAISNPEIKVLDDKAMSDVRNLQIPIVVASLEPKTNLFKIVTGEEIGTYIGNDVETILYEGEQAKFTYQKILALQVN